jgi:hypothetical protein
MHFHGREDETVYVLERDSRWKLGDELRGSSRRSDRTYPVPKWSAPSDDA